MLLNLECSLESISATCRIPFEGRALPIIFFLLAKKISQVHEKTWHCQACWRSYIRSKRHNVTLGQTRQGTQDTCFRCSGAWKPEVEMVTFSTTCKILLLTQLFSAGVRKGRMIHCMCFVEVGNFLVCVAHSQDETGLWKVKVYHCFQAVSSIL